MKMMGSLCLFHTKNRWRDFEHIIGTKEYQVLANDGISISLSHTKDNWRDQSISSARRKVKSPDIAKYMSNKGLVSSAAKN